MRRQTDRLKKHYYKNPISVTEILNDLVAYITQFAINSATCRDNLRKAARTGHYNLI